MGKTSPGWRVVEWWLWWDRVVYIGNPTARMRPAKGGHECARTFSADGPVPHLTRGGRGIVGRLRNKGRG